MLDISWEENSSHVHPDTAPMLKQDLILFITFILTLIHLLGVLSAIHAVASVRTPQGAIAWAISLSTFPYITLPLYWILGRNRFHSYVEALRSAARRCAPPASRCRRFIPRAAPATVSSSTFATIARS